MSNQTKNCTCTAEPCPVDGTYQQEGTIYQATVSHSDKNTGEEVKETYIGMTGPPFIKDIETTCHHLNSNIKKQTVSSVNIFGN